MNIPPFSVVAGHDPCDCVLTASVVIPCFNAGAELRDQLAALAGQDTPGPWELILSDNGSTDGSLGLVDEFRDAFHRLVVVDASGRRGASHARNTGAAVARSENLLFCDADDIVDRFWVHELVRALRSNRYVGGRLEVDDLNRGVERHGRSSGGQLEGLPAFYGETEYVMTSNMGIKTADFLGLTGFDEDTFPGAAGEDVDFALRAARLGIRPSFVAGAVVHYRFRPSRESALQQARTYGANNATLLVKNPELPTISIVDDIASYLRLARNTMRDWLVGRRAVPTWHLRYELAKTQRVMRERSYWSVKRRHLTPKPQPTLRGQALRKGLLRLANRLQLDTPEVADDEAVAYWTMADVRRALPTRYAHLVGLGLLDDTTVTLELDRPPYRWYSHAAADSIVHGLLESGSYSSEELAAVVAFVKRRRPGRPVVINVGANIGTSALPLATAGWHVIAIEPAPRAAALLMRNVVANGLEAKIDVIEAALGHEDGETQIVVGANLSISEVLEGSDVADDTEGEPSNLVRVEARTLASICRHHSVVSRDVALVWSDTEGSEAAVVATGADLWADGVPLWVELRPFALAHHVRLTDFCALVESHFESFRPVDELNARSGRPTAELREFIDCLGRDEWTFTNVMLHN